MLGLFSVILCWYTACENCGGLSFASSTMTLIAVLTDLGGNPWSVAVMFSVYVSRFSLSRAFFILSVPVKYNYNASNQYLSSLQDDITCFKYKNNFLH